MIEVAASPQVPVSLSLPESWPPEFQRPGGDPAAGTESAGHVNAPEAHPAQAMNWLFVDLNSYFASVEQEVRPELRGRPVGVVPMMADTTVCIAASYEARPSVCGRERLSPMPGACARRLCWLRAVTNCTPNTTIA